MEWTFANFAIQTIAGLIGSNIAAAAAREHQFGFWGHSLVGLAAGALGGLLLQGFATTVVTGSGDLNAPTNVEIFVSEALIGVVVGAIAMLVVGLIIKERAKGG